MDRELKYKPVNLYGSKWLRRIEDSSDLPEMESPVMRNDKSKEDFAKRLIFEEMARSSPPQQQFNQNLETPSCLPKLYIGYEKADLDRLESECNVSTTSCQTPRECQTRSYATLEDKSSMIQRSTPTASAKQYQTELDLPQSGSEDEDKRGSRNLLESRTKRNQEQRKLRVPKKQRFTQL